MALENKLAITGSPELAEAEERSPIREIEIKHILKAALTDDIHSRKVYTKGIDHSYYVKRKKT